MRFKRCIHRLLLTLVGVFLLGLALQLSTTGQLMVPGSLLQVVQGPIDIVDKSINVSKVFPEPRTDRYHLLINSYMNSGSRFTGQLFGFRHDAFYFYEPLWRFSVWDYFHESNQVCSSLRGAGKCSYRTAGQVNVLHTTGIHKNKQLKLLEDIRGNDTVTGMMTSVLEHVYNCNFKPIHTLLVPGVHDNFELAGPGWIEYKTCIRAKRPKSDCIQQLEQRCRQASHIVTKVLRMTTPALKTLLHKNQHLKIIQLFRDPRAIVNSRLESRGYPTNDVTMNSAALCNKMYIDYNGGLDLIKQFPDRFKFLFYDDIKVDIEKKFKLLYKFIGMYFQLSEFRTLNKVKTNSGISRTPSMLASRASNNANWWRSHISFARYQSIMDQCKKVTDIFNMTKFKDRSNLKQPHIPALNLPDVFKVNLNEYPLAIP